jgi:hypothetical protein
MSWLSSFLHPDRGYKAGQEQLDKYYNEAQGAYNPYMQNGQNAGNNLNDYMQQLMDPQALQDKWSQGYQTSGAAKDAMGMAQQNGLDAASSMGLMGSSAGMQALQAGTSQIQNADKQQYLDDLMKKYMSGAGIAGDMYNTGANAAGQFGQNAMNQGQNSAQMQYNQTNAQGNLFGQGLGTAAALGAGAAFGPMGYMGVKGMQNNSDPYSGIKFGPYGQGK